MMQLRWLVDPRSDAHRVLQYGVYEPQTWQIGAGAVLEGWELKWYTVPEVNAQPGDITGSEQCRQ